MLPGQGFFEIVVLAVIALLVVGPKDLPILLRTLGRWTRTMQGMAAEFRQGFEELARQTELDELRKEVDALRRSAAPFSSTLSREADDLHRTVMTPLSEAPAPHPNAPPQSQADADAGAPLRTVEASAPAEGGRESASSALQSSADIKTHEIGAPALDAAVEGPPASAEPRG